MNAKQKVVIVIATLIALAMICYPPLVMTNTGCVANRVGYVYKGTHLYGWLMESAALDLPRLTLQFLAVGGVAWLFIYLFRPTKKA